MRFLYTRFFLQKKRRRNDFETNNPNGLKKKKGRFIFFPFEELNRPINRFVHIRTPLSVKIGDRRRGRRGIKQRSRRVVTPSWHVLETWNRGQPRGERAAVITRVGVAPPRNGDGGCKAEETKNPSRVYVKLPARAKTIPKNPVVQDAAIFGRDCFLTCPLKTHSSLGRKRREGSTQEDS